MTAARQRHPNRTRLRPLPRPPAAVSGSGENALVLGCRCPVRVVAGTAWAYAPDLGWHDPAEHDTWAPPPTAPPPAPVPPALLSTAAAGRHQLLSIGPTDAVCAACGQVVPLPDLSDTPSQGCPRTR